MLAWFNSKKVLDKYDISKQRKQKLKPLHIHHSLENIKILEGIQMFSDTIICLYHPTTRIPNSSSSSVHMRVTFPRAPLPRDKHRFVQSSHQRERSPELQIFFISGDSSWDLHKQIIIIMYIKSNHKSDPGHKTSNCSPKRVGRREISSA